MARTTTSSGPLVLVAEQIEAEPLAWLSQRCRVQRADPGSPDFEDALHECDGLIVRTYTRIDDALLSRAPRLRAVARAGVGLDNIDRDACARRGVRVLSTPDANTQSVVEFTFAAILGRVRPLVPARAGLSLADWKADRARATVQHDMADLTLGIWGLGRIGRRIAEVASALRIRTIYHDLVDIPESQRCSARPVDRDTLLASSDVLTIHVDGRAGNRGLIGARELGLVKPGVLIVNTSRGFVLDSAALAAFLRDHPGAHAILDVHDPEPIGADCPLDLANATLTPHIAAGTQSAKLAMSWVVRDLWAALADGPEPHRPPDADNQP